MKHQLTKKMLAALAVLMVFPVRIWAAEGSAQGDTEDVAPDVVPGTHYYWLDFNGRTSYVNLGSDISLDNLPLGSFTLDLWVLHRDSQIAGLLSKQQDDYMWDGWEWEIHTQDVSWMTVAGSVHDMWGFSWTQQTVTPGAWHHMAMYFDRPTGYSYIAIDGVWSTYVKHDPVVGYAVDDNLPLYLGCWLIWTDGKVWDSLNGGISWVRISQGDRFGLGTNFVPPAFCAPPEVDSATIELWALDEGRGKRAAASIVPANQGTIVAGRWRRCVP